MKHSTQSSCQSDFFFFDFSQKKTQLNFFLFNRFSQNDEIVVIDSVNFHSQCLLIQKNQAEAFVVLRRNSVLELH